jgi:hypothetical protein
MKFNLLCAAAVVVATGCGDGQTGRVAVQGTVTFEGQPVAWGSIALRPAPGTSGPAAGSEIVDGKFEIPASAGPTAGSYVARITIVKAPTKTRVASPLVKGQRNAQSFDVPVEIQAERKKYDLRVPPDRDET